jgi:CRP-like cAMP-binding protein
VSAPGLLAALGGRLRRLEAGEVLFREGDEGLTVAEVTAGRVVLRRHLADGSCLVIDMLGPGEMVAEGVLTRARYGCEAAAVSDATVRLVPVSALHAAMARDAAFAASLIGALAGRVHRLRTRLALRGMRPASRRVLAALALEARGAPPTVMLARPLAAFAEEIGLTPPALYRTLAALEARGALARAEGRITLSAVSREATAPGPAPARAHPHAQTGAGHR